MDRWIQEQAGKREFTFEPNSNGYVEIEATPLLDHCEPMNEYRFEYEDGATIEREGSNPPDTKCLRYVTCGGLSNGAICQIYVLGNEEEYNELHSVVFNYIDGKSNHISTNHEAIDKLFRNAKQENPLLPH